MIQDNYWLSKVWTVQITSCIVQGEWHYKVSEFCRVMYLLPTAYTMRFFLLFDAFLRVHDTSGLGM